MRLASLSVLLTLLPLATSSQAQTTTVIPALRGLAPVSALDQTEAGKAALSRNFEITGGIQDGSIAQPTLLSLAEQRQQALRDAFITGANAENLADGLGSRLGGAYRDLAHYTSSDDGKTSTLTNATDSVARLIEYAIRTAREGADVGKFFFANGTLDGKSPPSAEVAAILTDIHGAADIFGRTYHLPAGSQGGDRFGDARPFQTEPHFTEIDGKDFFGVASSNVLWLRGPAQNLVDSPSYPSGHTTYGYTEGLLLALLIPERYPEIVARAAEYGNDRIIFGAHYAMDVLGGRTLATYALAQLLANKPGYVGVDRHGAKIDDFQKALVEARADLTAALRGACHTSIVICARTDSSRFASPRRNLAFYEATQTYSLPVVFADKTAKEDAAVVALEAGYLLTVAFPKLSLKQADDILTATEGPGGGFLDDGSAFGLYSRLDLFRAATMAAKLSVHKARSRHLTETHRARPRS